MRRVLIIVTVFAGLLATGFTVASAQAKPGDLDRTFGSSLTPGRILTGTPAEPAERSYAGPVLSLGDGSVISGVSGRQGRTGLAPMLVKQQPDGNPDPDFGNDGTVMSPAFGGRRSLPERLAVQDDSLIVLSRGMLDREGTLYLQRRDREDGTRDSGFGSHGVMALSIGDFVPKDASYGFVPAGLRVDSAGRIYVAGSVGYSNGTGVLIRLTPDGRLDRTFGQDGAVLNTGGNCNSISDFQVNSSGVILVGERCLRRFDLQGRRDPSVNRILSPRIESFGPTMKSPEGSIFVALGTYSRPTGIWKLDADGSIDPDFGAGGVLTPDCLGNEVTSVSMDSAGRFILSCLAPGDEAPSVVGRLTADGSPDPTFGTGGVVSLPPGVSWPQIAENPLPDGVVLVGFTGDQNSDTPIVVKLSDDGNPESGFGEGGLARVVAMLPPADRIFDTVTMTDRDTLAGGRSGLKAAFIRYRPNGRVDRKWGQGGRVSVRVGTSQYGDEVRSVARTADGGAVGCIEAQPGVWAVRVTAGGSLDPAFDGDGLFKVPGMWRCAGITALLSGKVLIGGSGAGWVPAVVRLSEAGDIDRSYGEDGWGFGDHWRSRYRVRFAFDGFQNGSALISTSKIVTKLTPRGSRDPGFGPAGMASIFGWGRTKYLGGPMVLRAAPRGGILVAGKRGLGDFTLVKMTARGKPARSFGRRGVLQVRTGFKKLKLTDLRVQGDGKPVISATTGPCYQMDGCLQSMWIGRRTRIGKSDRSFGRKGTVTHRFGLSSSANSLTLTKGGILVGGYADTVQERDDFLLFRLKR